MAPTTDPKPGERYRSRDPRDEGLTVRVLAVEDGRVRIERFNKTSVRLDRFHRDYELVVVGTRSRNSEPVATQTLFVAAATRVSSKTLTLF